MPTDEERREVVARLRELPRTADADGCCTAWDVLFALGAKQCDAIGFVRADDALRLADLIDRPTCRNVSWRQDVFECSECRCRVELITEACNEYGEPFSVPLMPSYCPNCGAEIEGEGE